MIHLLISCNDAGLPLEEIVVDEYIGDEDEADFIMDEEVVEYGAPVRYDL